MGLVTEALIPIRAKDSSVIGKVRIMTLPQSPNGLWNTSHDLDNGEVLEPVQVVEGYEYRYAIEFQGPGTGRVKTNVPEVFLNDTDSGLTGRFRPGLFTGVLAVEMWTDDSEVLGSFYLEVRSKKLNYLGEYRWMLRDIAESMTEVVMERFAPSTQSFVPDSGRDPAVQYQRFAFVASALSNESFVAAMQRIVSRPHVTWSNQEELRRPAQGLSGGSNLTRRLAGAGPRVPGPALVEVLGRVGVPEKLRVVRSEPTVDNTPNQFVKFALLKWLELATSVGELLAGVTGPAGTRGRREAETVRGILDGFLCEELFREVGSLTRFPASDQVLQKRQGYRDIFNAFVLSEMAAELAWAGGEDVYGAGKKDVATLYEYWTFLQLAKVVAALCNVTFDRTALVSVTEGGLGVDFKRGKEVRLHGTTSQLGRTFSVELWFNRTFSSRTERGSTSWTRPMRPDCSLFIRPIGSAPVVAEPVWLHFDAKYRIEGLLEVLSPQPVSDVEEEQLIQIEQAAELKGSPKRADLLKMHAYRDAIHRSAGAYILYPGVDGEICLQYHELLPGLGAFALRPSETGDARGVQALGKFLNDVVLHLANQVSQHERSRYWVRRSFEHRPASRVRTAVSFLTRPAADTVVLLGFVKDRAHVEWVRRTRRYNLRADDRSGSVGVGSQELAAELLALYAPTLGLVEIWEIVGAPELFTQERLLGAGYPNPRGRLYFCLPLGKQVDSPSDTIGDPARVLDVRKRFHPNAAWGAPVCVSWLQMVQ